MRSLQIQFRGRLSFYTYSSEAQSPNNAFWTHKKVDYGFLTKLIHIFNYSYISHKTGSTGVAQTGTVRGKSCLMLVSIGTQAVTSRFQNSPAVTLATASRWFVPFEVTKIVPLAVSSILQRSWSSGTYKQTELWDCCDWITMVTCRGFPGVCFFGWCSVIVGMKATLS